MRVALTYNPPDDRLRMLQIGTNNQALPETVNVGDYQPQSGWVVAIVETMPDATQLLQAADRLLEQGRRYEQDHQPKPYRFYALFRFYVIDAKHATTVTEKVNLQLLGETETARVVGYDSLPDAEADLMPVWDALAAIGVAPAPTQFLLIPSGALSGQPKSDANSVAIIDTEQPSYSDWRPIPTQVMANPVIEATAVTMA